MLNRLTVIPEHKGSCGPDSVAGPGRTFSSEAVRCACLGVKDTISPAG